MIPEGASGEMSSANLIQFLSSHLFVLLAALAVLAVTVIVLLSSRRRRRRAEAALKASEIKYRGIFENAVEGIYQSSPEGRLLAANPAMAHICGFGSPAELLASARDVRSALYVDPRRADDFRKLTSTQDTAFNFESQLRRKDGSIIWISENARAVRDDEGRLVYFEGTLVDITEHKTAEIAIRESQTRYRTLFESAADAIMLMDGDLFIDCNSRSEEMFGLPKAHLIGQTPYLQLSPEIQPDGQPSRVKALEKLAAANRGEPQNFIWQHRKADGTVFDAEVNLVRVDLEDKSLVLAFVRDITTRKRAEESLEKSLALLRAVLESTADGIVVEDTAGDVLIHNHRFRQMWNLPADWATQHTAVGRHTSILGQLRDQQAFLDMLQEIHESKSRRRRFDILELADGRIFEQYSIPYRIGDHIDGRVWTYRDLTDRRQAEEAARKSAELYRNTVDSLEEWIHVVDRELRFELINRSLLRICSELDLKDQPVGRKLMEVFHFLSPRVEQEYRQVFQTGRGMTDITETRLSGRTFITENKKIPILENDGRVSRVITLMHDITQIKRSEEERLRLEAQFQHAQKLESLGILAGGIAHDFNNLLTGILGNADLAMMELPASHPARANVAQIEQTARLAAELTRQLLAYSGKGQFLVQSYDLNALVHEMIHLIEISVSKRCSLRFHPESGLPPVEVDASQIRQIVLNLAINASEAISDAPGVIRIQTGSLQASQEYLAGCDFAEGLTPGTFVYLEVSDTGCGMSTEVRKRIFDPFFTTKFAGRGLGLAAVMGIVRGHQGGIRVETQPGQGSPFRVLFPVSRSEVEAARPAPAVSRSWLGQGVVLVVDDEPFVRNVSRSMLIKMGFEVLTAADGREGVDRFRAQADNVRLVLLDLTMPEMSGREALAEIRKIRPDVPVILFSGYHVHESREELSAEGVTGFLQKPFRYEDLLPVIRQALEP